MCFTFSLSERAKAEGIVLTIAQKMYSKGVDGVGGSAGNGYSSGIIAQCEKASELAEKFGSKDNELNQILTNYSTDCEKLVEKYISPSDDSILATENTNSKRVSSANSNDDQCALIAFCGRYSANQQKEIKAAEKLLKTAKSASSAVKATVLKALSTSDAALSIWQNLHRKTNDQIETLMNKYAYDADENTSSSELYENYRSALVSVNNNNKEMTEKLTARKALLNNEDERLTRQIASAEHEEQKAANAADSLKATSGSDFNLGQNLGIANLAVGTANGLKSLTASGSSSSGASKGGQVNTGGGSSSPPPLNLNNDWDTGAGTGFRVTADDIKKEANLDTTIATGGSPNATDGAPSSSASKLLSTDVKNAIKDRLAAAAASSAGKAGASTGGLISDKSEGIENQNGEGAKTDDTGKNTDVLASIETGEGLGGGMSDLGLAGSDTDASIKDIMQDMLGSVMGDDPTTDSNNRSPASVGEITFDLNGRAIVPSNKDIGNEESTPLTERIRSAIQRQFAKGNIVYGLRNKI